MAETSQQQAQQQQQQQPEEQQSRQAHRRWGVTTGANDDVFLGDPQLRWLMNDPSDIRLKIRGHMQSRTRTQRNNDAKLLRLSKEIEQEEKARRAVLKAEKAVPDYEPDVGLPYPVMEDSTMEKILKKFGNVFANKPIRK